MGEINTRGAIRTKISSFPAGNDSECLTKSEILSTGVAKVNGSYGENECSMIGDVQKKDPIVNIITITFGQYSGTTVIYANAQYSVSTYINIVITGRMYSGGTTPLTRPIDISAGHNNASNGGRPIFPPFSAAFTTADSDDTYIYQIVIA